MMHIANEYISAFLKLSPYNNCLYLMIYGAVYAKFSLNFSSFVSELRRSCKALSVINGSANLNLSLHFKTFPGLIFR